MGSGCRERLLSPLRHRRPVTSLCLSIFITSAFRCTDDRGHVHTIGTRMPRAPASSAYLICHPVPVLVPVAGMRTSALGAVAPSPVIAWMDSAAPGWSEVSPCSQSIMTHERCGLDCATVRALITPGKVIHAPKAGLEALKDSARACVVMGKFNRTAAIIDRVLMYALEDKL